MLMPDNFTAIGVPEAKITRINTGENLPDKEGVRCNCQIDRSPGIPEDVYAKGYLYIMFQFADYPGHRCIGYRFHISQVRETEFV